LYSAQPSFSVVLAELISLLNWASASSYFSDPLPGAFLPRYLGSGRINFALGIGKLLIRFNGAALIFLRAVLNVLT
jgi:hypothetical protein